MLNHDCLTVIQSFLVEEHIVKDWEKYVYYYVPDNKRNDEYLKRFINLRILHCGYRNKFTDKGLSYLSNLKEMARCGPYLISEKKLYNP